MNLIPITQKSNAILDLKSKISLVDRNSQIGRADIKTHTEVPVTS